MTEQAKQGKIKLNEYFSAFAANVITTPILAATADMMWNVSNRIPTAPDSAIIGLSVGAGILMLGAGASLYSAATNLARGITYEIRNRPSGPA
jgi:hypothetical protein